MIDEHDSRISSDWLASRKRTVILWGIPMLFIAAGIISGGLRPLLWSVGFLWIGAACSANAFHCRRMHCVVTGPLFLVLGVLSVANSFHIVTIDWGLIGNAALVGTVIAFIPEWFGKKHLR